jgi:hypothetical protein
MKRVEFILFMPGSPSWNGRWSGEGRRHAVIRKVTDRNGLAKSLDGRHWRHQWPDGWTAGVTARVMDVGERAKPSQGFCGYDWMVDDIIRFGQIRPHGAPENWKPEATVIVP